MSVKDSQTPVKRSKGTEPVVPARFKEEKPSPFSIEGIRRGAVASNIVKVFLVASGLIMAGGFIVSSLNPAPELARQNGDSGVSNPGAPIAQIGAQTVTKGELADNLLRQEDFNRRIGQLTTAASYMASKQSALEALTGNAATIEAAKAAGIQVTDADVEAKINEEIDKSLKPGEGQTEAQFRRAIETRFGSVEKAKEDTLSKITPEQRDGIRDGLYVEKLQKQVEDANKVSEDDYKRSQTKLKLRQIVVRPPLPKDDKAPADPKAGEAAALAKANKLLAQLKGEPTAANFAAIAKAQSDDPISKAKGGEIGWKLPTELGPDVGDAVAKSSGTLVGPFAGQGGAQNIFLVENRALKLPADYAKNKKNLLEEFEKAQDAQAWSKRQDEIKKAATPAISDAALVAYKAQTDPELLSKTPEEQKKTRAAAIEQYKSALPGDSPLETAAINYQMAQLYGAQNNKPAQLEALKAASKEQSNDSALRIELARALREAGQPKLALDELKAASKTIDENPAPPSMFGFNPDDAARGQLAAEFRLLKETKLAEAEQAKIKPQQPGGMGGMMGGGGIQIQPQGQ